MDPELVGQAFVQQFGQPDVLKANPALAKVHDEPLDLDHPKPEFAGDEAVRSYAAHVGGLYEKRLRDLGVEPTPEMRQKVEQGVHGLARDYTIRTLADRMKSAGQDRDPGGELISKTVPFAGAMLRLPESARAAGANRALESGQAESGDYKQAAYQLAKSEREAAKSRGEKIVDLATSLPVAVAEWTIGSPAGAVGRGLAGRALGQGVPKLARAGAEAVGEGLARTATTGLPGIAAATLEGGSKGAVKEAASEAISNTLFSLGGVFGLGEHKGLFRKVGEGVGTIIANKELQSELGLSPQTGLARRLLSSDPAQFKDALGELAGDVGVIGGLEALLHGIGRARKGGGKIHEAAMGESIAETLVEHANQKVGPEDRQAVEKTAADLQGQREAVSRGADQLREKLFPEEGARKEAMVQELLAGKRELPPELSDQDVGRAVREINQQNRGEHVQPETPAGPENRPEVPGQGRPIQEPQAPALAEPRISPESVRGAEGAARGAIGAEAAPQGPEIQGSAPAGEGLPAGGRRVGTDFGFKAAFETMGGGAVTDKLYGGLFESLAKGKETFAGVRDPVLVRAREAFDAGLVKSPADLRKLVDANYDAKAAGLSGEKVPAGGRRTLRPIAAFADEVQRLADTAPQTQTRPNERGARFYDNKIFIGHLYGEYKKAHPEVSRAEFDRRMLEANNQRELYLSRADLVEAMHPEDVRQSSLKHPAGAEFHFVQTGTPATKAALARRAVSEPKMAPAEFKDRQEGYTDPKTGKEVYPGFDLYNLTEPITVEGKTLPAGSTVSAETLRKGGYEVPEPTAKTGRAEAAAPEQALKQYAGGRRKAPPADLKPITDTDPTQLLDRIDAGEGGLTDQEKEVLQKRLLWNPSFKEMGKELGVSHEEVRLTEAEALRKLGHGGSVHELHQSGLGRSALADVEDGKEMAGQDLHIVDPRGILTNARIEELSAADAQLDKLYKKLAKEKERGRLTPEREAQLRADIARHRATIESLQNEAGATPRRPAAVEGETGQKIAAAGPERPEPVDEVEKFAKEFAANESGTLDPNKIQEYAIGLADKIRSAVHHVSDGIGKFAGQMFPATHRADRASGEALTRFAAAPTFAREAAPYYIDLVAGKEATQADRRLYGAVMVERRLRHMKDAYLKAGDTDAAGQVKSIIGGENSPLPDEQAYQQALKNPKVQEVLKNFKDKFVPVMEDNFRRSQGMETDDPINSLTQIPGEPVNLKAIRSAEDATETTAYTPGGRGNLKNVRFQKNRFAVQATGAAYGYDVDLGAIIEHSLSNGVTNAAKAEMARTMVENGIAHWNKPGQKIEGMREIPFSSPPKGTQTSQSGDVLYVADNIYQDVRQALAVDQPTKFPIVGAFSKLMTYGALASTAEATYHTKNLLTFMAKPGVGPISLIRNAMGVVKGSAESRARLVELARIGAMKDKGLESGGLHSKYNPMTWMGNFIDVLDRTMRLTADDAFNRLNRQGRVEGSERNRAEFVNQLGQYNRKAQNKLVVMARDIGLGPFATAGTNYWMQGVRAVTMNPGVKATSFGHAVGLRAEMLAKTVGVLSAIPLVNFLAWGRVDGDDNTPFGAIKVGDGEGGRTKYLDLANLVGVTRGLRQTGLLALAEGDRRGEKGVHSAIKAKDAIVHGLVHPFFGPPGQFLHTTITGENTLGYQIAEKHKGERKSTLGQGFEAALKNANPLYGTLTGADRPDQEVPTEEKLWKLLGPFGVKYAGGRPKKRTP